MCQTTITIFKCGHNATAVEPCIDISSGQTTDCDNPDTKIDQRNHPCHKCENKTSGSVGQQPGRNPRFASSPPRGLRSSHQSEVPRPFPTNNPPPERSPSDSPRFGDGSDAGSVSGHSQEEPEESPKNTPPSRLRPFKLRVNNTSPPSFPSGSQNRDDKVGSNSPRSASIKSNNSSIPGTPDFGNRILQSTPPAADDENPMSIPAKSGRVGAFVARFNGGNVSSPKSMSRNDDAVGENDGDDKKPWDFSLGAMKYLGISPQEGVSPRGGMKDDSPVGKKAGFGRSFGNDGNEHTSPTSFGSKSNPFGVTLRPVARRPPQPEPEFEPEYESEPEFDIPESPPRRTENRSHYADNRKEIEKWKAVEEERNQLAELCRKYEAEREAIMMASNKPRRSEGRRGPVYGKPYASKSNFDEDEEEESRFHEGCQEDEGYEEPPLSRNRDNSRRPERQQPARGNRQPDIDDYDQYQNTNSNRDNRRQQPSSKARDSYQGKSQRKLKQKSRPSDESLFAIEDPESCPPDKVRHSQRRRPCHHSRNNPSITTIPTRRRTMRDFHQIAFSPAQIILYTYQDGTVSIFDYLFFTSDENLPSDFKPSATPYHVREALPNDDGIESVCYLNTLIPTMFQDAEVCFKHDGMIAVKLQEAIFETIRHMDNENNWGDRFEAFRVNCYCEILNGGGMCSTKWA